MPKGKIYYFKGNISEASPPGITVENRAFRYGDGIFETIKIHHGQPYHLDSHLSRLMLGMVILGFRYDPNPWKEEFRGVIKKILEAGGGTEFGRLRVQVFREEGGNYTPDSDLPVLVAELLPLEDDPWLNPSPVSIVYFYDLELEYNRMSAVKSCNALPYILAGLHAKRNQADDALLFCRGAISESSCANLFMLARDGQTILTPSLFYGCLPGVMRRQVMLIADELGYTVRESQISPEALSTAREVFLTNVVKGPVPVRAIGGKEILHNDFQVANAIRNRLLEGEDSQCMILQPLRNYHLRSHVFY